MNPNLDIEKILEALQNNLTVENYEVAQGIIELLEYHGFSQEVVLQLLGDFYLGQSQYQKAIEMYEAAVKIYKKQNKSSEINFLNNHIRSIKNNTLG